MINRRRKLQIVLGLMLVFVLCFNTSFVSAKSLTQIQKEIEKKQTEIKKDKEKKKELSSQINDLEEKVYELNSEIASSEVKLEKLTKDLKKAKAKVKKQNEDLSVRLRNMYKNGNVGFMDVLMNSSSFSEFLTNLDMVELVYASDKEVLENLKEAHDEIKEKKEAVETLQAELKSSRATAESNMETIAAEKKEIEANIEDNDAMLRELEAEAESVAAEMSRKSQDGTISNSNTSKYDGGQFSWPTPGFTTITSGYGWRICPFHGREFHGAIDIAANSGSSIVAAADGKVISAGWNGGFGYSVQVDHGGGVVTMYNHCSSIAVSYGAQVSKGQTIARVGSTGSSTGPHLDYRVFVNGSTVS
ncbi:MAG: peptidoglycan DD-metalloendopeptidase family protein, partial [Bacillota bacterium]|nr:peptidoglycan DD-metalloendopeptidase family protein [Bacillota bacterium]